MTIQEILNRCPETGELVIKANVFYDNPRRIVVTGYRPENEIWTNLEREDYPQDMSDVMFQAAIERAGLNMARSPVKQAGVSYHYFVARIPDVGYHARCSHAQAAERQAQEQVFDRFRFWDRLQWEGKG
jgi:hypothetical protein